MLNGDIFANSLVHFSIGAVKRGGRVQVGWLSVEMVGLDGFGVGFFAALIRVMAMIWLVL